ncbi:MAG: hypothetical protein ACRCX2_34775 [Paraclostridium sp.]
MIKGNDAQLSWLFTLLKAELLTYNPDLSSPILFDINRGLWFLGKVKDGDPNNMRALVGCALLNNFYLESPEIRSNLRCYYYILAIAAITSNCSDHDFGHAYLNASISPLPDKLRNVAHTEPKWVAERLLSIYELLKRMTRFIITTLDYLKHHCSTTPTDEKCNIIVGSKVECGKIVQDSIELIYRRLSTLTSPLWDLHRHFCGAFESKWTTGLEDTTAELSRRYEIFQTSFGHIAARLFKITALMKQEGKYQEDRHPKENELQIGSDMRAQILASAWYALAMYVVHELESPWNATLHGCGLPYYV